MHGAENLWFCPQQSGFEYFAFTPPNVMGMAQELSEH